METKVHKKKCVYCGKLIESLSKSQCQYNHMIHILSCRRKYKLKGKCEDCGSKENLEFHHVDGNHKNTDDANIKVLCSKCHGLRGSNQWTAEGGKNN